MARRLIGNVTPDERDQLKILIERKNALRELSLTIADAGFPTDNHLYEKMLGDMANTQNHVQEWWKTMGDKYQWEGQSQSWYIIFDACEIYLTEK